MKKLIFLVAIAALTLSMKPKTAGSLPTATRDVCPQGTFVTGCHEPQHRCRPGIDKKTPQTSPLLLGMWQAQRCREVIDRTCPLTSNEQCCEIRCSISDPSNKKCLSACLRSI
jgi:hypothetical protein